MASYTLGHPHRHPRRHPRLVLVVCAVEVAIDDHQTLDKLKGSGLPENRLGTQKPPGNLKVAVRLLVSSLQRSSFLSLYGHRHDNKDYT